MSYRFHDAKHEIHLYIGKFDKITINRKRKKGMLLTSKQKHDLKSCTIFFGFNRIIFLKYDNGFSKNE